ncbi:MAG: RIP metalloprotease RseP [Melioribacteraceae bacterium]|nr:RIP metalloprotease RseP [Melioribacteraceae bacterium]
MLEYIVYFGITIGILVFIHEFGHFAAAKLCNMRADVFAIGFGKRLFGWNKITGFTFGDLPEDFDGEGDTDYRLCAVPLGGYVKIAGMVDESFDNDFADEEPQPYEFRAKPTYQKLFVITAGVLMNLILTFSIFWGINFFQGKPEFKTTTIGFVTSQSLADSLGFKTDDKIVKINGADVLTWHNVLSEMLVTNIGEDLEVDILRNNENTVLEIPSVRLKNIKPENFFLKIEKTNVAITQVLEKSPADSAGIKAGDIFLSLNNIPVNSAQQTTSIIKGNKEAALPLIILREEDTVKTTVIPGADGLIGVGIADAYTGPLEYKTFGFFESITLAGENIANYTGLTLSMVKKVIIGDIEVGQAFGGPIKIAKFAADSADAGMTSFLFFLAMLSLSLAILNIMPFPVLDGGHFVIILIEGIIKREIPIKIKIAIQNVGFVLLLLLMAVIIYYDFISI